MTKLSATKYSIVLFLMDSNMLTTETIEAGHERKLTSTLTLSPHKCQVLAPYHSHCVGGWVACVLTMLLATCELLCYESVGEH